MEKQTAVDYIFSQLPDEYRTTRSGFDVYRQAKVIEKDQMMEFAQEVFRNRYNQITQSLCNIADDIYNETFGK